jgi:hypothetical protein
MKARFTPWAGALLLAFAAAAQAGTHVTAPVHNDVDRVGCVVQNRGSKDRTVTATLRDFTGGAISSSSATLPPGGAFEIVFTASFQPYVYCEFSGTSRTVRGYLEVEPAGGATTTLMLPAE